MARVVQQQKSAPPYLLILFVFLFLIATTVAVLMYLQNDKQAKAEAKALDMQKLLAGSAIDNPAVQAMLEAARSSPEAPSVVGQLQQKVDQLTELITGDAKSSNAVPMANDAYREANQVLPSMGRVGLGQAVKTVSAKAAELRDTLQKKDAEIASLKGDIDHARKEIEDLGKEREKERTDLNAKVADLDKKLDEAQKAREKAVADLTADRQKEMDARDKIIAERSDKITRDEKEIQELKGKLAGYEKPKPIGPEPGPTATLRQANGKVLRVGDDTVYVNLGRNDRIRPGLTFAIYPASGIPDEPNNFVARVVVNSVGDSFAACRITALRDRNEPVVPGDLVYNVAFDRARTIKFVVVGLFDIYGTRGRSEAQGADEVKTLIQRFGGSVENDVGPDTDYVVVGEEPAAAKAAPPGETAAPASPELEKARQQYKDALAKAQTNKIPILNANRFLQLVGFERVASTGGM